MINVKYECKDNIALFEVKGHANYAKSGKDIVCATVSVALIMTANLLERIDQGYNVIELISDEGYFRLKIKLQDKVILAISDNLRFTLAELADEYPKYVKYNG